MIVIAKIKVAFTITTPATGGTLTYQWQSSTDSLSGYSDIGSGGVEDYLIGLDCEIQIGIPSEITIKLDFSHLKIKREFSNG